MEIPSIMNFKIFGVKVDFDEINWYKDYVSNFEYPLKRFDKIKISKWFDKGIDIKFTYAVPRFCFAIEFHKDF